MTGTLGVIVGNRDFFPDHLIGDARAEILSVLKEEGIDAVMLDEKDTKLGSVETHAHAKACAELFKANRSRIEGVLVVLPNFGDEKGVADTIKLSGMRVPILVQAYPDELGKLNVELRRDALCGKISVCNNLRQYGYAYSLTKNHTVHPKSDSFREDLRRFMGVCRVVKGLDSLRIGAIGARPGAFNTVRYSEKLLQASGITVETVDLSEMIGEAGRLSDDSPRVKEKIQAIQAYASHKSVPSPAIIRMAKLGLVITDWMSANDLQASALQCWTSIQKNFGINACTLMSMMSDQLIPSACEVDITGAVSMYALQLASTTPSILVDWNNNYADNPDKCAVFHCGNWAKSFVPDAEISTAPILGTTIGEKNTYGAMAGRALAGSMTFGRVSTDDTAGAIRAYVGDGQLTDDPLDTFGQRAVARVDDLQGLLRHICLHGFEHHVAITMGHVAPVLCEALATYKQWDVYHHRG